VRAADWGKTKGPRHIKIEVRLVNKVKNKVRERRGGKPRQEEEKPREGGGGKRKP